jgi:hypothetical protein
MTSFGPGPRAPDPRFALAALAARLTAWAMAVFAVIASGAWVISRGPEAGLGLAVGFLPVILASFGFAWFLSRGNRIAAGLFGLWCLWGIAKAIQGDDNAVATLMGYAVGVLNFIGLAGVVKGFSKRTSA